VDAELSDQFYSSNVGLQYVLGPVEFETRYLVRLCLDHW